MTPIQFGVLCFTMATILAAWVRGGHPERFGAGATLIWTATSITAPPWLHYVMAHNIPIFEVALELTLLAAFVQLALRGSRWWPFGASAVITLSVLVYLATAFVPELDRRAEISAHVGLVVALDLTLLAGIFERWLVGERPVSEGAIWRRGPRAS